MKVDLEKAVKLLNEKTKMPVCPLCGKRKFLLSDYLFQLPQYGKSALEESFVYPVLPLTCEHCGAVYFMNAISLGLVKPKGDNDGEESSTK